MEAMPGLVPEELYGYLAELGAIERLVATTTVIEVCRDEMLPALARMRRSSVKEARRTMRPKEIAHVSGHSPQTIGRLLVESISLYQEESKTA